MNNNLKRYFACHGQIGNPFGIECQIQNELIIGDVVNLIDEDTEEEIMILINQRLYDCVDDSFIFYGLEYIK